MRGIRGAEFKEHLLSGSCKWRVTPESQHCLKLCAPGAWCHFARVLAQRKWPEDLEHKRNLQSLVERMTQGCLSKSQNYGN